MQDGTVIVIVHTSELVMHALVLQLPLHELYNVLI